MGILQYTFVNLKSYPTFVTEQEANSFFKDKKYCMLPIQLQIERKYDETVPNKYHWKTYPCICYNNFNKPEYKCISTNLDDIFDNYKKHIEILKTTNRDNDWKICENCKLYNQHKDSFYNGRALFDNFNEYGKSLYESFEVDKTKDLPIYPYEVNLCLESSCNLKCPTCRTQNIELPDILEEDLNKLFEYSKNCKCVSLGGDGELFLNSSYMKMLQFDYSNTNVEKIILYTNGTLLNKTNWDKINPKNIPLIKEIKISIDAANEETYKKVRSQTLWNTLMDNIKFIKENKPTDCILSTTFTISKFNCNDIIIFPDFSRNIGFDRVCYSFARPILHNTDKNNSDFVITDETTKYQITYIINKQIKNYNNFLNNSFIVLT